MKSYDQIFEEVLENSDGKSPEQIAEELEQELFNEITKRIQDDHEKLEDFKRRLPTLPPGYFKMPSYIRAKVDQVPGKYRKRYSYGSMKVNWELFKKEDLI